MPCVDATPLFLGFGLQLLQVGMMPLIGADLRLSTAAASWLVTSSPLAGIVFLASLWGEAPEPFLRLAVAAALQLEPRFYAWLFVQRLVTLAGKDPKALQQALDGFDGFDGSIGVAQVFRDLPALRAREAKDALRPYAKAQLLLALELPEER